MNNYSQVTPPFAPVSGRSLESARRRPRFLLRTIKNAFRYGFDAPKPGDIIYIDPAKVAYRCRKNIVIGEVTSEEVDWREERIEELPVFLEVQQRILEGKSWEEIGSYKRIMTLIKQNGSQDGCMSEEDLVARYQRIDDLIQRLMKDGRIKSNKELGRPIGDDDIKVHVCPNGEVVKACGGGMHRFSIARILGLTAIPALVCTVHEDAVRTGNYSNLKNYRGNGVCQRRCRV